MISRVQLPPGSRKQSYKIISRPVCEPIDLTLEQTALRVQVDTASFDIANRIATARRTVENFTRRTLVQTTYDMFLDDEVYRQQRPLAPWGGSNAYSASGVIEERFGHPPFITLIGAWTRDDFGTETLIPPDLYYLSSEPDATRIRLADWQQWPYHRGFEAFRFRFATGYVTPFQIDSNGFLLASNHGLTAGSIIRLSSRNGQLPGSLQPNADYTVMAVAAGTPYDQISINDNTNTPVTGLPQTSEWSFIGEIEPDILRAVTMLSSVDNWSDEPGRADASKYSAIQMPLSPMELLHQYVVPMM